MVTNLARVARARCEQGASIPTTWQMRLLDERQAMMRAMERVLTTLRSSLELRLTF